MFQCIRTYKNKLWNFSAVFSFFTSILSIRLMRTTRKCFIIWVIYLCQHFINTYITSFHLRLLLYIGVFPTNPYLKIGFTRDLLLLHSNDSRLKLNDRSLRPLTCSAVIDLPSPLHPLSTTNHNPRHPFSPC